MVVAAVDHRDLGRSARQCPGGGEAAEAGADDDDARAVAVGCDMAVLRLAIGTAADRRLAAGGGSSRLPMVAIGRGYRRWRRGLACRTSMADVRGVRAMAGERVRIGILGASGYTGAELLRLLGDHPRAEIRALTAERQAGKPIGEVFPQLADLRPADLGRRSRTSTWPAWTSSSAACRTRPPRRSSRPCRAAPRSSTSRPTSGCAIPQLYAQHLRPRRIRRSSCRRRRSTG